MILEEGKEKSGHKKSPPRWRAFWEERQPDGYISVSCRAGSRSGLCNRHSGRIHR